MPDLGYALPSVGCVLHAGTQAELDKNLPHSFHLLAPGARRCFGRDVAHSQRETMLWLRRQASSASAGGEPRS
jgi:hypothetical protein